MFKRLHSLILTENLLTRHKQPRRGSNMNDSNSPDYESYEAWLGSGDDVQNYWQTKSGETFAITDDSVYLPDGIGPVEGDQQVPIEDLDSFEVDVEFLNNPRNVAIPFAIGGVLALSGIFIGEGIGVILLVAGILSFLAGGIMVVKERNEVTALTHITFHMGRFNESIVLEGDVKDEINPVLEDRFRVDETFSHR